MFDVIYPTAPGVHLNGALWRRDIDRVVLSIGLLGARVAEKAAVSIWVTVHHNHLIRLSPTPLHPVVWEKKKEEKKEEGRADRAEEGESNKSPEFKENQASTQLESLEEFQNGDCSKLPRSENL